MGPPQIGSWSVTGHLSEVLGLSPSLFSSPGKLLPEQILEDDAEYLSQGERLRLGPHLLHPENTLMPPGAQPCPARGWVPGESV